nr:MAG TPA_asm: hypothetical protein [Caudoviricetes sp.]
MVNQKAHREAPGTTTCQNQSLPAGGLELSSSIKKAPVTGQL